MRPNDSTVRKRGYHHGRRKVDDVIAALIQKHYVEDASQITGVPLPTIYRWMREESFQEKYALKKHEVFEPGYSDLRHEFSKTVRVLVKMRDDSNVSDAIRLGVCRTLLEYGSQVDMKDYYDAKIAKLEAKTINSVDAPITTVPEANSDWVPNNNTGWTDQPKWEQ